MATADKANADELLVATEDFACDIDEVPHFVSKGKTRVRRGDALHLARPESWEPVDNSPTIEVATKAPGEKRT